MSSPCTTTLNSGVPWEIAPITEEWLPDVVALQRRVLPNALLARCGQEPATEVYRSILASPLGMGFVARTDQNLAGFVSGTLHRGQRGMGWGGHLPMRTRTRLLGELARRPRGIVNQTILFAAQVRLLRQGHVAALLTIGVEPEHHRMGIGHMLVDALSCAVQEAGQATLHLDTARDNLAARAFYERLGFRRVGETPTHCLYLLHLA